MMLFFANRMARKVEIAEAAYKAAKLEVGCYWCCYCEAAAILYALGQVLAWFNTACSMTSRVVLHACLVGAVCSSCTSRAP